MILNDAGGGSGATPGSSRKEYLYGKYVYLGKEKWLYSWYLQNGVKKLERTLISRGYTKPTPRPTTSRKTKQVTKKTPVKSTPKPVPKKPAPPKRVAKPTFGKAKPAAVSKFVFDKQAPRKREVIVPQPPPPPGPKPEFTMKSQQSVTKFEYLYGIKHLDIRHTQYDNKSVYVSKPINVAGNVMSVSLHAIEEHPLFDELTGQAADRQTSVEYYIAPVGVNPSPTLDEWFPILPEDVRTVKSELLMFGTARTAELRFPALVGSTEKPAVYKNGLKMEDDEWSYADGGYKVQLLVEKDNTAIYTIDYTPNSQFYNPWSIDINQQGSKPIKHIQSFENGTNHNKTVVLEKYPYVNYEKINTTDGYDPNVGEYIPVKVTLADAGILGQNKLTFKQVLPYDGTGTQLAYTKNMSNYKTGTHSELKKYSILTDAPYNGFEYYHEGDKLFFTETFNKANIFDNAADAHGNATIQVEYEYLSSDFRMKIILRRNSTDENTLTPIVHEYALKFKVMK